MKSESTQIRMKTMRVSADCCIVVLLLVGVGIAQQSPSVSQTAPSQHEPIAQDLSNSARFTFKIAPNLPEFTFKVIPEVQLPDQEGNPHSTIRDVQVFRDDAKQPSQSLEDCEWEGMEAPPRNADWFRALDMNLDGYKDIFVLTNWGATGNEQGCVWLYDSENGRFEYSNEYSELGRFEVDPKTKTITTHSNGGAAGTIFQAAKYAPTGQHLVLLLTVEQDYDFASQEYHCVVKRSRGDGNGLQTIRDVRAKAKAEFEGPCEPSDPFRGVADK